MIIMKKVCYQAIIFLLLFTACQTGAKEKEINNKEEFIKTNLYTMVDCWNQKDMSKLKLITAENFMRNVNDINTASNRNEMESAMNIYFTAFPDLRISISNLVITDSCIFTHWKATGTNTGIFGETAATGKKAVFSGSSILYYDSAGKFSVEDVYFNELILLQQLGYTYRRLC